MPLGNRLSTNGMLSLSTLGKIDDVLQAIKELPAETKDVSQLCAEQVKAYASARVEAMRCENVNAVHINLVVSFNPHFNAHQTELQINGRFIK